MFKSSVLVPTLLRSSSLWSSVLRRLLIPLEHIEIQGYPVYGFGEENYFAADELRHLTAVEIKSLSGNGIHSGCAGSVLAFGLASCIPHPFLDVDVAACELEADCA